MRKYFNIPLKKVFNTIFNLTLRLKNNGELITFQEIEYPNL